MFGSIALKLVSMFGGGLLQNALSTAADVYKARLVNGEDHDKIAADLAAKQLQLNAQEAQFQASLTHTEKWYGPRALMGYAVAFYVAKILVWDKSLHLGVTDPVDDRLWWIITTIIIAYFGARTISDAVLAFRARQQ